MTWENELQKLDDELAAGIISAAEYRTRRDALAAGEQQGSEAGGAQPEQPSAEEQGTPSGGAAQQSDRPSSPFPPPFSWNAAAKATQQPQPQPGPQPPYGPQPPQPDPNQPQPGPDQAQPQSGPNPVQPGPAQPQSGPNPVQPDPAQPQPGPNPVQPDPSQAQPGPQSGPQPPPSEEPTHVVPNPLAGGPPPQPQPWTGQQQWNAGWTDQQAVPEHGDASWMRQGPEVFEVGDGSSRRKLIVGLSVGAVLVAGVAAAGVLAVATQEPPVPQSSPTHQQPAPPPPPAPTSDPLPEPPAPKAPPAGPQAVLVPPPPGPPHPFNGLLDRPGLEGPKSGVLRDPVRNAALQGGMADGWINRTDGPPSAVLLAVRMPNDQAASAVVQAYLADQQGLKPDEDLSYRGVQVMTTGGGVFRTAYAAHGWAVVVETSDANPQVAEGAFKQLLSRQVEQTPPTVRE